MDNSQSKKPTTIKKYLHGHLNDRLYYLLSDLFLVKVPIDEFFKMYGNMSPEEVIEFISDPNNSFKLGLFGSRASSTRDTDTYNGKDVYIDTDCSTHKSTLVVRKTLDRSK